MRIKIEKEYRLEDLETFKTLLERRYGGADHLQHRAAALRCTVPHVADDYITWRALSSRNPTYTENLELRGAEVFRMMSPRRMELLEYLLKHSPASIKHLALDLKRDYKNVYDDVHALEAFGLVSLEGHGKQRRPVARVSRITIEPE